MAALIAAASTAIINSLGRIAAFLFSWAMVGFFGRMPPKRQYLLAGIGLLSMLWIVFAVSIVRPEIVQFLFLLNRGLQNPNVKDIIQRFALGFALVLPLVIGFASLFVDAEPPPTLGGKLLQVLKGWLIAPGFAIGMILMMITTVITLGLTYLKRLKTEHVPIKLKEGGYETVLRDLRDALTKNGVPVREQELPWYLKPPVAVMALLAKSMVQGLVTPDARMLRGDNGLTLVAHPTDLVLAGPQTTAMHARAVITQRVPFTEAYLTWEESSQKFEDRITALWREWRDAPSHGRDDLQARLQKIEELKAALHKEDMPFDQWEVVYRELLQLQDELVSGRVQRGEQPVAAAPHTAGRHPLGNDAMNGKKAARGVLSGGRNGNGATPNGATPNGAALNGAAARNGAVARRAPGSSSELPLDELALAEYLVAAYWWWASRRES